MKKNIVTSGYGTGTRPVVGQHKNDRFSSTYHSFTKIKKQSLHQEQHRLLVLCGSVTYISSETEKCIRNISKLTIKLLMYVSV